jgi:dUTP pyrophosphatase
MKRVARFEKVSFEQFKSDFLRSGITNKTEWKEEELIEIYDKIKLPKRSTSGSAGYDFYLPVELVLVSGVEKTIPTGIKAYMEDGWVLQTYPRSGQGFKYKLRLNNTVGIIDKDYYNNESNEGHIMIKVCVEKVDTHLKLECGQAFAQGIFVEFGITEDDECETQRTGGFGSTDN